MNDKIFHGLTHKRHFLDIEENLDEIPFTTDLLSIDMIDDDSVGPEEKLKYFYSVYTKKDHTEGAWKRPNNIFLNITLLKSFLGYKAAFCKMVSQSVLK